MRSTTLPPTLRRPSCSVLALATVMVVGATPASAQSFLGSGSFTNNGGGSAGITTAPNLTTITVNPGQSVIDWSPTDTGTGGGSINFQPSGTTANFVGATGFAVLNRINPADSTRSVTMNGLIQTLDGNSALTNGSLYFYTPGGFVIGNGATINVGSLVLSASPITVNGSGQFIVGNSVTFGQASQPGAAIVTNSTAQINAIAGDAYVAMVAPRVQHGGSINVTGSAALVGAEAATINFSPNGLFDIQVTTGTTDTNGVSVSGSIGGTASTGAGDIHRAYLVAVPKNAAITMLVANGSSLGFDIAGAANVVGNTVVLSAGHNVSGGGIESARASAGNGFAANLLINGTTMTSAIVGAATGNADIFAPVGQSSSFASDVTMRGVGRSRVGAQGFTTTVNIAGNLDLSATRTADTAGQSVTGGLVEVYALDNAAVTVTGTSSLFSNAFAGGSSTAGVSGGQGVGGNINVTAQTGGDITLTGGLSATADGFGGYGAATGSNGGNGIGGQIDVTTVGNNSSITIKNGASLNANGQGGRGDGLECFTCDGSGGNGTGGTIDISAGSGTGSSLTITGDVSATADGFGGDARVATATAGIGAGGAANYFVGTGSNMLLTGNLSLSAQGTGGYHNSANGGSGFGGRTSITEALGATGGTIVINGNVDLDSDGIGGATNGTNALGGIGTGGTSLEGAFIFAEDSSITINGSASVTANGTGGYAYNGTGGGGFAGRASVTSYNFLSISGGLSASANATGGGGVNGGSATGGAVDVSARFDGILDLLGESNSITANAMGGGGSVGGDAIGGDISIFAQSGGDVTIAGGLTAAANGFAGYGAGTGGNGGDGTGGDVNIWAGGVGSSVTVNGILSVLADGWGGAGNGLECFSCDGDGGTGTGGTANFGALNSGSLALLGESISASTSGYGGAAGIGDGGNAFGGLDTAIYADGTGVVTISGATTLMSNATGGSSDGAVGGAATGGDLDVLTPNGGNLIFADSLTMSANATGGAGTTGGGNATGGTPSMGGFGTLQVNGNLTLSAEAVGGRLYATDFNGFSAGNAQGGTVTVFAQNGSLDLLGAVHLSTDATGGAADNNADFAGDGTGGTTRLTTNTNGIIELGSTLNATAVGRGGGSMFYSSTIGGDGQGGAVRVQATAADATISVAGSATLDASGEGSSASGGNGTGGTVWADTFGAATASLDFQSDVTLSARGIGGDHDSGGNPGNGQGGQALLQASAGSTITVGGDAIVDAGASGGDSNRFSDGIGGSAVGGVARIQTFAGTGSFGMITIDGSATVSADGSGGNSNSFIGGTGGEGRGGSAHVITTAGTINIGDVGSGLGVSVSADGYGGNADNGDGGDGFGGTFAKLEAFDGDITVDGYASVSVSGYGGNGLNGGDGIGGGATPLPGTGAFILARNGDIVILSGAGVTAEGTGGDGSSDFNGYNADSGGNGGNGTGGWASILAQNSNLGPSLIDIDGGTGETAGFVSVNVSGNGGDGGNGLGANLGGNGGNGGNGRGGTALVHAAAGNGRVDIGSLDVNATASGGLGGNGGNGDGAAGGNGGSGGNATGGIASVGTDNGSTQSATVNLGQGNFGSIHVDASATAGDGGDGNFGATDGSGGAGGDAVNGRALLLVRGSLVDAGNVTLIANATGGNGGLGGGDFGLDGNGGDATIGQVTGTLSGIDVVVTERGGNTAQRGTLVADSIVGQSIATAGTGEIDGLSQSLGGNVFVFRNSGGTLGSVNFLIQADTIGAGAIEDAVAVHPNGTVTVGGAFNFVTSGNLSLLLDNATFTADSIRWHATDFVPDTVTVTPSVAGTFFARTFDIQTDNNFVTTANLDSVEALTIVAPGAIQIGNVTGDANIALTAESGEIDIGNVLGAAGIDLDAGFFVSTGNVVGAGLIDVDAGNSIGMGTITNTGNTSLFATTSINVGSIDSGWGNVSLIADTSYISGGHVVGGSIFADSGNSIFLGNLTAVNDIELLAVGDIFLGNALAGENIDLDAGGYVDGGNMTAGDSVYVGAGDYVDLLNISAGLIDQSSDPEADYNVGILAGTTINTGNIAAFNSIGLGADGNIRTGNIDSGDIFLALGGGDMSFGTVNSDGPTYLANVSMIPLGGDPTEEGSFNPAPILAATPTVSGGSITLRGPVAAGRFVAAASGAINGSTIGSDTSIHIVSGGNVTLTDLDAGTFVFQRSNGTIIENDIDAGSYVDIRSAGGLALGNLVAGDYVDLRSTGAIGLGNAASGETIYMISGTSVTGGDMTAGNSVLVETTGAIQLGNITAGITNPSTSPSAEYAARLSSGADLTVGNVQARGRIGFGTPTDLVTGNLSAGEGLMALVGSDMSFGSISADNVYLANYSMAPLGGAFLTFNRAPILALPPVATGGSIAINGPVNTARFEAAAGTTLTAGAINSGGLLYATSGGNMNVGNLTADNDVRLTSGANIVTGSIDSGDDIALVAAGSISTLDIFAYDDVSADAGTTITTGDITGNSIDLFADGAIDTGDLLTQDFFGNQAQLQPGASITIESGGNVDTGTIASLDGVYVSAGGNITTGAVRAETFAEIVSAGNMITGNITAGTDLFAEAGGTMALGILSAADIELDSFGNMSFISANSGSEFDFSTEGSLSGGNVTAASQISGDAVGSVTLANLVVTGPPEIDEFASIGIAALGNISVGNVTGVAAVGFATESNLTVGNVAAGGLFLTLVGGDITTGSITTTGQGNGQVYMADASMFATGGGVIDGEGNGDFDPSIVLALAPVATGGSITINGPVTTGRLQAAAGDDLVTRAITASQIDASAGDNATLDGIWRAGQVSLRSGDINITSNGGIDAGTNGSILLNAVRSDGGALIGDGLTGTGYALSNAEFGRISGGGITIAVGGSGGDADTLIGDLTITGPLAGSNVESSDGGVEFVTLQEDGLALDGTLRVVGDITVTGFGPDNYLGFYTQNFELDAATGSIVLTGTGGALAGTLELYASRIHVAEGSLLDQLAVNPQFTGYREALNRPAAVSRPAGVINAANFDIGFGGADIDGPYTLFVQNMGTTGIPAGFLLNAANISDDGEGDLPPGSIDMAINGQIQDGTTTLTGVAVRDLLVTEFGTDIFVSGSTINGCQLTGSCSGTPPRVDTIVRTDVQINDPDGLGDGLFGNEPDIDDGQVGDENDLSSPIEAPVPLFDSRPLAGDGDVDDPISGAGNPSLLGTSDEDDETCDSKDSKCKTGQKGDGK